MNLRVSRRLTLFDLQTVKLKKNIYSIQDSIDYIDKHYNILNSNNRK